MSAPVEPIGLIAGSGRFPIAFASKARALNLPVVCVGVRGEASSELEPLVDQFHLVGLTRLGQMIRYFKRAGVRKVVMAGKIQKVKLNTAYFWWHYFPDWRTITFWFFRRRRDNKDDSLLLAVVDEFARDGIVCTSALDLCPELLVKAGVLTKRVPSIKEEKDIAFGWELAKEMGRLDVGQSVAVNNRAVLAVEAIEGTDQAILRAGTLCPCGGFTVVKVAKPQQDMRFDVPTVGCATIESMHKAGAKVLAIEADKTIVIDQEETIALANRYGMTIIARAA